jgi:choline-sulfatase
VQPSRLSRRSFLKAMAACGVATLGCDRRDGSGGRPPNVLLIMSDEHNAGVLGCYGNDLVRTPNLDRLARGGVVFDACYCNSPLCAPSRLSFTSGKYVSKIGAWNNQSRLPSADHGSLPRTLESAGYRSFLCGKMHYDLTRRYGFTELGENRNQWRKTGEGKRRAAGDLAPGSRSERFDDFRVGDDSPVLRHDRGVTRDAMHFLAEREPGEGPFLLVVGYLAPHFPLIVPERYWAPYRDRIPLPVIPPGHLEAQPRNYRHLRAQYGLQEVPVAVVKRGRELYYGLTQWLDEQIGELLATLDASAVADDTVVFYTSDHGENLGEHGLWWKKCMYEHATRVPLVASWPGRWAGGQRRRGACSLVDLTRTIADVAGARAPSGWDGRSMLGWLDDPGSHWRDLAISEFYGGGVASGYAMLRTGDYKYVYHVAADARHPAERELYDLRRDPGEFENLAGRSEQQARIRELHVALVAELGETPEQIERRCLADLARGYERAPA